MKKVILLSALFIFSIWFFVEAWSIEFSPWEWSFGQWCIFGIDVNIDTQGADIAAFDLVVESSMSFHDFIPSEIFPYYLPPVIKWNIVHLVWFATDPNNWINTNWSIWKMYFKSNPWDTDWSVRIYFVWEWDTRDSNLSIPWWIDTLTSVKDWYYTFTSDWECVDEHDVIWWYKDVSYKSWLDLVVNQINTDYKKSKMKIFWETSWVILISILILLLILWYLHRKWYLIKHKTKVSNN